MDAVIVTYNSARDLRTQLACAPLRAAFDRIVVVDNASADDSVQVARDAGVEVVARAGNDGFAAGVNAGVAHLDGDLVAVLNPDVLVDDAAVVPTLAAGFAADPRLGLVAPSLVLPDGTTQDSAREVPAPLDLVVRRLSGARIGQLQPTAPADVAWIVAAFVAIRREAFDAVGGFDANFLLYFEDVDFCVRLWEGGWRVRLDPTVTARHEHRASSRRSLFGWAMRRHLRSAARFFAKHPRLLAPGARRAVATPGRAPAGR